MPQATSESRTTDIDLLVGQILKNCHISDATHAGVFSVCGLALRLRDLYKWEKQLPPWKEKADEEILDWIGRREDTWEQTGEEKYQPVTICGQAYDPFDTEGVNGVLKPLGMFYGAGYAYSLKPTFFLARTALKKKVNGFSVYYLGRELVRDLMTLPALSQGDNVVLRTESARMYLWDQIQYLKKSGKPYLKMALDKLGAADSTPAAIRPVLPALLEAQAETYVHHEIGELSDTVFDRQIWQEMIADHPHTPVELLVRSVRDLLADTGPEGTLHHLVDTRNTVSLALFAAFLDGLLRELFPEFRPAFRSFAQSGVWPLVEKAISTGHRKACRMAADLVGIHLEGKNSRGEEWVGNEIRKKYLDPLQNRSGPKEREHTHV